MTARALLPALLLAVPAAAEPGWLTARGRVIDESRLELYVGTRSAGAGLTVADRADPALAGGPNPRSWAGEVMWNFADRVAEGRLSRVFQINQPGFATASATLGADLIIIPEGHFDVGLGPTGGLTLSLGRRTFSVDLGLQTAVDVFLGGGGVRVPVRALLGLNLRVSNFTVSAMARLGADLAGNQYFVGRGELLVAVGWLGLH